MSKKEVCLPNLLLNSKHITISNPSSLQLIFIKALGPSKMISSLSDHSHGGRGSHSVFAKIQIYSI